jgi:hypothetical protein
MRIFELEKPKTPEQLRLDQLRVTSKRASDALKTERERQKAQRAQQALQKLRMPTKPKSATIKPIKPIYGSLVKRKPASRMSPAGSERRNGFMTWLATSMLGRPLGAASLAKLALTCPITASMRRSNSPE